MSLVISWLSCNVIAFVMTLNESGVFDTLSGHYLTLCVDILPENCRNCTLSW